MALAAAGLLPITAFGGSDWALCGAGFQAPPAPAVENGGDAGAVHLSADDADLREEGVSTLRGNVHVRSGTQQLQSDVARYDKDNERLEAEGNVRYWDQGLFVTGSRGQLALDSDEASAEDTSFMLLDLHGHGTAERVEISGSELIRATGATYSTCNPGDDAWLLSAESIKLDKVADVGTARNVTVKFKNVPIFYSPYLTFPLSDKRKTGFLTPSFRTGGEVGLEVRAPYYWNISPNQDATLVARGMTNRGAMMEGEYRYLTRRGGGEIGVEYLAHDTKRGDDRGALSLRHRGSFAPGWNTDIAVDYVSDKEYFEELGTQLTISSIRFLDRRADLTYSGNRWWAQGRMQSYQTVDNTILAADKPYERLPQVRFGTAFPKRNRRLHFGLGGEVVNFQRDSSVTGTRVDLEPSVSFPIRTPGTFIIPQASLRHTQYSLDNTAAGVSDDPSRTLPILSVDSGMFFDREMRIGGNAYTQTLEPRAYYLLVPYDDQRTLPVFDTGEYSFNFAQLF
ncbi:MAG: LPS-assembly protein LptD, partial [Gammaproteobacteria bacterium]